MSGGKPVALWLFALVGLFMSAIAIAAIVSIAAILKGD